MLADSPGASEIAAGADLPIRWRFPFSCRLHQQLQDLRAAQVLFHVDVPLNSVYKAPPYSVLAGRPRPGTGQLDRDSLYQNVMIKSKINLTTPYRDKAGIEEYFRRLQLLLAVDSLPIIRPTQLEGFPSKGYKKGIN